MLILALSATLESPKCKKSTFRNYVTLRNRGVMKLQSRELGHMLNPMTQSNFSVSPISVSVKKTVDVKCTNCAFLFNKFQAP